MKFSRLININIEPALVDLATRKKKRKDKLAIEASQTHANMKYIFDFFSITIS
jgi:hypothetical protein